jgi:predicted Rossmann fold nucleotide-binding protein DprA/Smf involved in DNA uptake
MEAAYPALLRHRLGSDAPAYFSALGNLGLLAKPKSALFCSARCPGASILRTYDQAALWRDERRCVISGFHSPVEKECLRIFLRGQPPVIICPARSLPKRVPRDWLEPLAKGRLLVLSFFPDKEKRVTTDLAVRRNLSVAALADDCWFAHITPGGQMERLHRRARSWQNLAAHHGVPPPEGRRL